MNHFENFVDIAVRQKWHLVDLVFRLFYHTFVVVIKNLKCFAKKKKKNVNSALRYQRQRPNTLMRYSGV